MADVETSNPLTSDILSPLSERRRSSRLTSRTTKPIYTDTIPQNDEIAPSRKRGRPANKKPSSPKKKKSPKKEKPAKKEKVAKPKEKKKKIAGSKKSSPVKKKPKLDASFRLPVLQGMVSEYEDNLNENGVVKSAKTRVIEAIRAYTSHYLRSVQEEQRRVQDIEEQKKKKKEEKKEGEEEEPEEKRPSKRPDLKAISKMLENETVVNHIKRIGHVPGVEVGDKYFSRGEMVVVGLHNHWLNGIDYMGKEYEQVYSEYEYPLAVCVVLSGQYEDDLDLLHTVTYTGQGGHDLLGNKEQIADQKLERGNLALVNNFKYKVPVRLVRGHKSAVSYTGKEYTYSGLYMVTKYWPEKGVRNFVVYKYKLERLEGQKEFTSSLVKFYREGVPQSTSDLKGLVCEDISGGLEKLPIPATNVVDDEPGPPTGFEYINKLRIPSSIKMPKTEHGCNCVGDCSQSRDCPCAKFNGSDFPYVRIGDTSRLMEAKSIVFECGAGCKCSSCCINKTSQQGLQFHLEVYKTIDKGWAVKSWDTIPAGAPICEYVGVLRRTADVDSNHVGNNYIFDIDCVQTMKGLDGRDKRPGDVSFLENSTESDPGPEYCIDAGTVGNVARFINHSCQPNLFVQCILSSHHDFKLAKIVLFAADTIPPLQELTYDYGYGLDSVVGPDGKVVELACHCGATECRRRLY